MEQMQGPEEPLLNQYEELTDRLRSLGKVAIAFSGGVDSTFLLYAAREALGDKVLALTAVSASFPERETREANDYCASLGVRQLRIQTEELQIEGFRQNPKNRCYLCKKALFQCFQKLAGEEGFPTLAEGSNLDDEGDYRPGLKAIAELGVISPLRELKFTKDSIRRLSEYWGLPTWNKPSFACLATRFPYGEEITTEGLLRVDRGEQFLMDMGFHQVRVRNHGNLARIELLPEEFPKALEGETRRMIDRRFREIGFTYVALDLGGYRTGSMNETLSSEELKAYLYK